MKNRFIFGAIGSLVAVIVIIIAYIAFLLLSPTETPSDESSIIDNDPITVVEPPLPVPDFTLTDTNSDALSLSDLTTQPTLITFGFTHCPDICPLTLGEMRNIHTYLEDMSNDINYVFVSVDGERDTPQVLATYLTTLRVDDFVIGLTGNEADIREMGMPYGLEFIYREPDRFDNYNVDHTAGMFLVDAEQNWIRRYRFGTAYSLIGSDIRDILEAS